MENSPYQLVVIDASSHALLLVNSPEGEIIAEMPYALGFTPTELALSPDFTKVYLPVVGKNGNGGLFVANLTQKSMYRLPMKLPQPIQFALAPDGIWAYLADPAGMLYALDIPSLSFKSFGNPTQATCIGLVADHTAVYSVWEQNEQGLLIVYNRDGTLLQQHTLPGIPTNITLDTNGHIFIPFTTTNFAIEGVLLFNKSSSANTPPSISAAQRCIYPYSTSPSAAYPSHVAPCPNDHIAYVVNEENASITVIDSNTAAILRHLDIGRSISCLHILPGGQLGIATSHIFADLCIIDLCHGHLLSTTNTKREILGYMALIPL